jgi:hypothetical protein
VIGQRAERAQHDYLAGPGVATHPDLGIESGRSAGGLPDHGDRPARVLIARLVGRLDGGFGVFFVDDDDEGEHPPEGDGSVPLP